MESFASEEDGESDDDEKLNDHCALASPGTTRLCTNRSEPQDLRTLHDDDEDDDDDAPARSNRNDLDMSFLPPASFEATRTFSDVVLLCLL